MIIADLLAPQRIRLGADAKSKKKVLECVSALVSESDEELSPRAVFECLHARERLGSTGLGFGVALPHGRMEQVKDAVAAFLRLEEGVDFESPDSERVDLVFGLLVPQECTDVHLEILASAARCFSDPAVREGLRRAASAEEVTELLKATAEPA